jgi:hypothetical protein
MSLPLALAEFLVAEIEEDQFRELALLSALAERSESETAKRPRKKRVPGPQRDPRASSMFQRYLITPEGGEETHPCETAEAEMRKFRNAFRMSRATFRRLVRLIKTENWFPNAERPDALGRPGTPLSLLVLCSLNVLGRATVFAEFEMTANLSGPTVSNFFDEFCAQMRARLYPRLVKIPRTPQEIARSSRLFAEGGFDGCVGAMDATHVVMRMSSTSQRHNNVGKEGVPTRSFNVCVDMERRILHSTTAQPGKLNDKTTVHFDKFVSAIRAHELDSHQWTRYDRCGNPTSMRGVYLICDGGYHDWPCTISGYSFTVDSNKFLFARWLSSLRKCVECTFGILKCRFTILKNFRYHTERKLNDVWFTCLALHNMLVDETARSVEGDSDAVAALERFLAEEEGQIAAVYAADTASHVDADENDADSGDADDEDADEVDEWGGVDRQQDANDVMHSAAAPDVVEERPAETFTVFRDKLLEHWLLRIEQGRVRWPYRLDKPAMTMESLRFFAQDPLRVNALVDNSR